MLLLIVSGALANEEASNPSNSEAIHCFTEQEVFDIEAELDELESNSVIDQELIKTLKLQVNNYKFLTSQDSLMLSLKTQEIELLRTNIKQYKELVKLVEPKWYENKWVWFTIGVFATAGSIKLAAEITD